MELSIAPDRRTRAGVGRLRQRGLSVRHRGEHVAKAALASKLVVTLGRAQVPYRENPRIERQVRINPTKVASGFPHHRGIWRAVERLLRSMKTAGWRG